MQSNAICANWSIPTESIYQSVPAQASAEIVQEVASLLDKFPAQFLADTMREMLVSHAGKCKLQANEVAAATALIQVVYEIEHSLKFGATVH